MQTDVHHACSHCTCPAPCQVTCCGKTGLQYASVQARDNVKFLTTLERHFRSISSGPLAGILDTLPPLMNALRMVWIISRHYSDDARMGTLFARIATELCDRVDSVILLHTLLRMPAAEAVELLSISKAVLENWQSTYMQVLFDAVDLHAVQLPLQAHSMHKSCMFYQACKADRSWGNT